MAVNSAADTFFLVLAYTVPVPDVTLMMPSLVPRSLFADVVIFHPLIVPALAPSTAALEYSIVGAAVPCGTDAARPLSPVVATVIECPLRLSLHVTLNVEMPTVPASPALKLAVYVPVFVLGAVSLASDHDALCTAPETEPDLSILQVFSIVMLRESCTVGAFVAKVLTTGIAASASEAALAAMIDFFIIILLP